MSRRILVTGGAGYIGSHTVRLLLTRGFDVSVLDDLSEGHAAAVPAGVELLRVSLQDERATRHALDHVKPDAVFHFAASCLVGESVADPGKYYRNNLEASLILLRAMGAAGCATMVFSSTAATYGEPKYTPIDEAHPQAPINPYGSTKRMFEQALADHANASQEPPASGNLVKPLRWIALRYFNAAGAAPGGKLGEDHEPESHLIPLVLKAALGQRPAITILGDDYATKDGTCVRDYIHIDDLADAHILALDALDRGAPSGAFNLGTGEGYTVREVIDLAGKVTRRAVPVNVGPRRPGDPAVLIADGSKARRELGWKPKLSDLETILATAWRWHETNPRGFGDHAP
jgi:UDP-glucose 4-epimerase